MSKKPPSYPTACLGRINDRPCHSKRFDLSYDHDNKPRWICLIKKCSETWTVTKEGARPK